MKKKLSAIAGAFTICVLLTGLGGCGGGSSSGGSDQSGDAKPAEQAEVKTDFPTTIDGAETTTDSFEGKQVIVVTYTWTNNSDQATSFSVALDAKAYQNGIELEKSYFTDDAEAGDLRDVKPGTTATVKIAYELSDTSEVEVEVKELFSFSDDIIASQKFAVQ